jgi:hypothetical protein
VKHVSLAALLVGAVSVSGCIAPAILTEIGAGLAGAKAGYDTFGLITADTSAIIKTACQEWRVRRAAADARIRAGVVPATKAQQVTDTEPWLDVTCDPANPPPTDPVAGAVWLATLSGRVDQLTKQDGS